MQISSSTSALSTLFNPSQDMEDKLASAVSNGSVSDSDAAALESALDSIDDALGTASSGSKLDPSQMKDRIDSLISDQVENGTLTEEQASTLQSLFAQGASQDGGEAGGAGGPGGPGGAGGPGGPRGAGGPPPGGSSVEETDETEETEETDETDETDDTDSTDDAEETDEADATLAAVQAFIENLKAQQAEGATYTASAATSATVSAAGLIVDQLA
ncbi:hypothetical protein ADT71_22665 [Novosphingobium sp. ST904]|nr:hypothetical protein ADT71_22665 [Novosphingobium sp. ST904]